MYQNPVGVIHGRPVCDCCGDETGCHTRVGPLMQLEDGTQRKARLDYKCGKKYDREVKAERGEHCSIEWLRQWRNLLNLGTYG